MYELLMLKSDDACSMAIEFYRKGEFELAKFWKNASETYKEKARNLSIFF